MKDFILGKEQEPDSVLLEEKPQFIRYLGRPCPLCSKTSDKPVRFSLQIRYDRWKPTHLPKKIWQYSYVSSKCLHRTAILYRNGLASFIPADQFDREKEIVDDILSLSKEKNFSIKLPDRLSKRMKKYV